MKVLITEKLSEHRYKTPEGYLVCVDAILARTGPQIYKHNQVYDSSTDEITDVEVDRKPEQVFSPQAIASFENKPLTIQHPNEPVTVANHKSLYHGFARDIRRAVKRNGQILAGSKRPSVLQAGDQEVLVGNIIVTTSDAIEEIDNGLEFLSCGYDCDITQTDKPEQINIRGNHIALCDNPRAGITMLQDNVELDERPMKHIVKVLTDALDITDNFVIDEQFIYVTPEYPLDSMTWLKYFAKELRLNVNIQIKSKYYDDKVYITGRKSDVEKLIEEYNALYRNRKLVATTSTEINSKRVYNKGYSLGDAKDDEIEGGLADKMSIEDIAKKHNVSVDVIVEQLIKGIDVEYEHTKDKNKATEIAKDHLVEMPDYYDKLEEMEKEVTDSNDSNTVQISKRSREFETVIREYHKKYGKILQVESMVYDFETGKYYMYNESTDYSFTSKRLSDFVEDALNYVVMCEQRYNGVAVKSRAPWIVFRSEDKSKAEQFVRENNAKAKSLVGFSKHYYIK